MSNHLTDLCVLSYYEGPNYDFCYFVGMSQWLKCDIILVQVMVLSYLACCRNISLHCMCFFVWGAFLFMLIALPLFYIRIKMWHILIMEIVWLGHKLWTNTLVVHFSCSRRTNALIVCAVLDHKIMPFDLLARTEICKPESTTYMTSFYCGSKGIFSGRCKCSAHVWNGPTKPTCRLCLSSGTIHPDRRVRRDPLGHQIWVIDVSSEHMRMAHVSSHILHGPMWWPSIVGGMTPGRVKRLERYEEYGGLYAGWPKGGLAGI
jgi:hypothetical protein